MGVYLGYHPVATAMGNRLWEFDLNAASLFLHHLLLLGLRGPGEVGKRETVGRRALILWVWAYLHWIQCQTQFSCLLYPLIRFPAPTDAGLESLVIGWWWWYCFCKHGKMLKSSNKITLKVTTMLMKFHHTHNHD